MGWISTIVVLNDYLHEIGREPRFGKMVEDAVLSLSIKQPQDIGHYATAIETHHNDGIIPVLVGHGKGSALDVAVAWHSEDPELDLLKRLAEKRGFNLHKKSKKRWTG